MMMMYHCLIAGVKNYDIVIATGTGGSNDAELIIALLCSAYNKRSAAAGNETNINNNQAFKAVKWLPPPKQNEKHL
eukprot:2616803-Ditylum_brightwellii.AAC.1